MGWSWSVVFGGSRQTWMLLDSKSSVTVGVIWPLKLSIITNAGVSSLKEALADLMYGINISSKGSKD